MNEQVLQMNQISKIFSGVTVLDRVDFNLNRGEIHVLIGENGAGKSTLMKILAGVYQKDGGEMLLEDKSGTLVKKNFTTPLDALQAGVSMVFQEFNLMNNMSIAENIFIGREPRKNGLLDRSKLNKMAEEELAKVKLDIPPQTLVENLTVAQKQCVEIAKCLSFDAKIIILDEPTSSLSQTEVEILFDLIRSLKEKDVSIVYISHRMEEIFEIGDRITVFRDGKLIDTVEVANTTKDELVKMIIGREFEMEETNEQVKQRHEMMLEGRGVCVQGFNKELDFEAYAGEILGVFGLVGAGRTELARAIFGIDPIQKGHLYKKGEEIFNRSPEESIKNRIGLVPEDRKELGLITQLSVRENLVLAKLREFPALIKSGEAESRLTQEFIDKLHIVTYGQSQQVDSLSGGNQQKVAISKWLALDLDILMLDEPTRGVDIGAKAEIYEVMRELANKGMSIIMISSDLPEILRVSDRVLVMHDGQITLEADAATLDQEKIMHAAIS